MMQSPFGMVGSEDARLVPRDDADPFRLLEENDADTYVDTGICQGTAAIERRIWKDVMR